MPLHAVTSQFGKLLLKPYNKEDCAHLVIFPVWSTWEIDIKNDYLLIEKCSVAIYFSSTDV